MVSVSAQKFLLVWKFNSVLGFFLLLVGWGSVDGTPEFKINMLKKKDADVSKLRIEKI